MSDNTGSGSSTKRCSIGNRNKNPLEKNPKTTIFHTDSCESLNNSFLTLIKFINW